MSTSRITRWFSQHGRLPHIHAAAAPTETDPRQQLLSSIRALGLCGIVLGVSVILQNIYQQVKKKA